MKNLICVIIGLFWASNPLSAQPENIEVDPETIPAADIYDIEQAKRLLGDNFFGPAEIKTAFGLEIPDNQIPNLPFTKADLEKAKELKQFLILRWPISINKMNTILKGQTAYGEKIFYDYDTADFKFKKRAWYAEEDFFLTGDSDRPYWVLVSNGLTPNSINKNYYQQTDFIVSYLKSTIYKSRIIPESYQKAIAQWEKQKKEIKQELTLGDEKKADSLLNALLINQIFRPTPRDLIYDLIVVYHNQKKVRLLKNKYALSRGVDKKGLRVYLGYFDAQGMALERFGSEDLDVDIGLVFQMP